MKFHINTLYKPRKIKGTKQGI